MNYYGLTEHTFKQRYNNHTNSFKHVKYKGSTQLSKYIWDLKEKNQDYELDWSIKAKAFPYNGGSKHCDLCLTEKTIIALADPKTTLNSRSEILAKCRHKRKFCLINF